MLEVVGKICLLVCSYLETTDWWLEQPFLRGIVKMCQRENQVIIRSCA